MYMYQSSITLLRRLDFWRLKGRHQNANLWSWRKHRRKTNRIISFGFKTFLPTSADSRILQPVLNGCRYCEIQFTSDIIVNSRIFVKCRARIQLAFQSRLSYYMIRKLILLFAIETDINMPKSVISVIISGRVSTVMPIIKIWNMIFQFRGRIIRGNPTLLNLVIQY